MTAGGPAPPRSRLTVLVCVGPTCGDSRGSHALADGLVARLNQRGLADRVSVEREMCLGHCVRGPNILVCDTDVLYHRRSSLPPGVLPGATLYNGVGERDIDRIVDRHLAGTIGITPVRPTTKMR